MKKRERPRAVIAWKAYESGIFASIPVKRIEKNRNIGRKNEMKMYWKVKEKACKPLKIKLLQLRLGYQMDGKDMAMYEFSLSYDDAMRFDDAASFGLNS
jgi:hypothetical protein